MDNRREMSRPNSRGKVIIQHQLKRFIFGLLGLVLEVHPIKVDYAKTVLELFTEVTKSFIDSNANLDIICQNPWDVREWKTEQEAAALPSWAVDFVNKKRFGVFDVIPRKRLSQDEIEADEKIFRVLVKKDDPDELDILYELVCWDMLLRTLRNWIFERSKTGLLLMASKEPREDDVVAILDGSKVPCLLRPFYDNNELRYRVIHSVYVHGYMDGRVANEVEHGRLQKQDILLA
ncbi:hypothetical protein F5Y01DRAFT_314263 [Xylaria sp. FL0043]|nr:hypothetical protein F5Y01DRAFT_314263 [Xylaria sp. FL0043]